LKSETKTEDVSLRDVMRTFPQGVVVVTASGDEGPRGITVSSFLSVSLTPPLVLVAIHNQARAHAAIDRGTFLVNVLGEHQGAVSDHFATPKLSSEEQFQGEGSGRKIHGLRAIDGCLGYLACKVVGRVEQGDHTMFIGEVEHAELGEDRDRKPLVFFSRAYWGLGDTVHDRDRG
jgi:flavin reductase (DIM6/NTAB) family NADH-FMN oxidoreductase RutF